METASQMLIGRPRLSGSSTGSQVRVKSDAGCTRNESCINTAANDAGLIAETLLLLRRTPLVEQRTFGLNRADTCRARAAAN
jgi:hypothetical protein